MSHLFACAVFEGFGPTRLLPPPAPPACRIHAPSGGRMRPLVRQACPNKPGVYGMFDGQGELLYVGKSKHLRTRLLSYFQAGRGDKAREILGVTRSLAWEVLPSEFAALLRELELIHRRRPRLNVQYHPRRHNHVYVCVGRAPAPHAFLSRRPAAGVLACHGPVAAGHLAREAVRRINDWYRLRDCPQQQAMVFAEQRDLFAEPGAAGCLRYDIGTCLGPCAGLCGRTDYAAQVQAARRFLLGQDGAPVAHLEQAMAQAAADQQFERAAGLRDQLGALQWLVGQLAEVRRIRAACSFVYPVTGHDQRELWYVIHGARVEAVVPRPATAAEERHLAATVKAVRRNRHPADGIMEGVERDAVLLLGAWFRQHPDELAKARPLDAVG